MPSRRMRPLFPTHRLRMLFMVCCEVRPLLDLDPGTSSVYPFP
jgi:hypothetical protein